MHTIQIETGKLHSLHPLTRGDLLQILSDIHALIARHMIPEEFIKERFLEPHRKALCKRLRENVMSVGWRFRSHIEDAIDSKDLLSDPFWKDILAALSSQFFVTLENLRNHIEKHTHHADWGIIDQFHDGKQL